MRLESLCPPGWGHHCPPSLHSLSLFIFFHIPSFPCVSPFIPSLMLFSWSQEPITTSHPEPNAKSSKERIQWLGPSKAASRCLKATHFRVIDRAVPPRTLPYPTGEKSPLSALRSCAGNEFAPDAINIKRLTRIQALYPISRCHAPFLSSIYVLIFSIRAPVVIAWNVYADWESLRLSDVLSCISNDVISSGSSWLQLCLSNMMNVEFSLVR